MKTVKLIDAREGAALVEYLVDGKLVRKTVPVESVAGNKVDPEVLELGIVYGADWNDLLDRLASVPPVIADEFHRVGIWTPEDLLALSAKARAALDRIIVVPLMESLISYSRED